MHDHVLRGPDTSSGSLSRRVALAALLALAFLWLFGVASAMAQTPAAPRVIFSEDFQNGTGLTELESYASSSGASYTADSYWLNSNRCNGFILSAADPYPGVPYCNSTAAFWSPVQDQAFILGLLNSPQNQSTNRAVSAWSTGNADDNSPTDLDGPLTPMIQFETAGQLSLPSASGRFVTFSVDADATNCGAPPLLRFYFRTSSGTEIPVSSSAIDPCHDPRAKTILRNGHAYTYGSFPANSSTLLTGSSLGIVMRNEQTTSSGNDGAFDNIKVLDVTPTLYKSFSPTDLNATAPARLTFTIENTSELAAKNGWSFTDHLPSGLEVADPASASTTCSGGQVTASAGGTSIAMTGNLNAGQASCTVSVDVSSPTAGDYSNCPGNVTLVGLNPPACAAVTFRSADVAITKTTGAPIVPGEDATYTITMTNHGPDTATPAVATDPLPSGLSFVSASDGCSEANGTVTCSVPSLGSGATATFTVKAHVDASADSCNELRNTVTATSQTFDPNPSNNTASACNFERRSDLTLTKDPSTVQTGPGGQVMYTLVVRNDGPSDNSNVTVSDPMAAGLSLVAAEPSQGQCSTVGGHVSCNVGSVKAGGSAQVLVTARMPSRSGCVTNTATASGDAFDPDRANNADSSRVCVPVQPAPPPPTFDLAVTKSTSTPRVVVGQPVTYRVAVSNTAARAAPNVTMTDTLSAPVHVVSVHATQGSCQKQIPMRCDLGTIAPGARVTITVVAQHRKSGCRQRNAASAAGAGTDTNPANNLDTVDVCVRKVPLKLSKVASRNVLHAGQRLTYRIRVTNPTKGVARKVQVCDRLPSGLVYVSSNHKPHLKNGQPCWTLKRLGAHKSKTFTLKVRALRGASGTKANHAKATSPDAKTARAKDTVRVIGAKVLPDRVTG